MFSQFWNWIFKALLVQFLQILQIFPQLMLNVFLVNGEVETFEVAGFVCKLCYLDKSTLTL